jgi:hypothetical protein
MAKIGAMARLRARRKARLEAKRKAAVAAAPVQATRVSVEPTVDPVLLEGLRAQVADAEKLAEGAKKAPKLVRSGRAAELKAEAVEKSEVLKKMEVVAATPAVVVSAPAPQVKVALTVFDQAVVILSVGTDILKISKWYALGGAALVTGLFVLAEKQGWLDFINF